MGQREDLEAKQSLAEQSTRRPVAWRYMLGDGKWRYQREWSDGAVMHPVYELTPEAAVALSKTSL
jgi:hypothetical protein